MDARDCAIMSEAYGMDPWLVDASGVSLARRPRLYWFNWEPRSSSGVSVSSSTSSRLPLKGEVELRGQVDPCDFLEPGWKRVESLGKFPTFTTARPSLTPGRKPAGLALCCEETVTRWRDDLHRFPPYQYRRENCVTNSQGLLRVPSVLEREVILGFPSGYTAKCLPKAHYGTQQRIDCRLRLLGIAGRCQSLSVHALGTGGGA